MDWRLNLLKEKELSVIISNRNDINMLCVTVRSCLEEFKPLGQDNCDVIVVDNSDPEYYERAKATIPTGYLRDEMVVIERQEEPCLFSARELAAKISKSKYIICLDSHMLVGRDMFLDLFNFMEDHRDDPTIGFAHAPITWAHQHECRARHDRDISQHELGPWGVAYSEPRTITWKGMPWICRRDWFLDRDGGLGGYGALADHRVSWGGGDMHIGVKPWLLGYKNWAVPTSPGIHIGPFPRTDNHKGNLNDTVVTKDINEVNQYRVYSDSGQFPHTFGFLVSCYVLGGEPMMHRNKEMITERFGKYIKVEDWWDVAIKVGAEEREWLLSRQKMSFEQFLQDQPWNNGVH